ncbi:MAG: TIM barrel protein, partial [Thermoguttaceae bacterium]
MATISVCLETVFTDLKAEERIARIAEAGYRSVEFWHPEGTFDGKTIRMDWPKDPVSLRRACEQHGVTLNDFAMHAWDGSIGGCPVQAQDRSRYLEQIRKTIDFAQQAGCRKGITLSGVVAPGLSRAEMRKTFEDALADAVRLAEKADFTLLLEPLNTLVDHPGYYLDSSAEGFEIVRKFNTKHLRLLYDVYHMQIMEGNILATIEKNLPWIGHFHSAGVPGRGEVFGTELNYPAIVEQIDLLGYRG